MNENNKKANENPDNSNTIEFLEEETSENQASYHVHEPEPAKAASVGAERENRGRNVMAAAAYGLGLVVVLAVIVVAFLYYRSGANTQNANLKVERGGRSTSNSSSDTTDPTYEEATNLIKPGVTSSPMATPLPSQPGGQEQSVVPSTNGSILSEPTTGYTLGGGGDYISPNPKPSNQVIAKTAMDSNSTSSGSTRNSTSSGDDGSKTLSPDKPPALPRILSAETEQSKVLANNNGAFSPNNSSATSIYYYSSSVAENDQPKDVKGRSEGGKYPKNMPFGTVLPVRLLSAVHSLSNRGLVQMELTRAVSDGNFFLPRGTQFVGRISGSAADRIFVELAGYLDNRGNLVAMSGDVLNTDGSIGIKGKRERLGSKLQRYLSPIVETARQFGLAYLQQRTNSNVIVLPPNSVLPVLGEANSNNRSTNSEFISVAAGGFAYIFINNLPPASTAPDFNSEGKLGSFSPPQEIKALTSDSGDVQKTLERLSPQLKRQIEFSNK